MIGLGKCFSYILEPKFPIKMTLLIHPINMQHGLSYPKIYRWSYTHIMLHVTCLQTKHTSYDSNFIEVETSDGEAGVS